MTKIELKERAYEILNTAKKEVRKLTEDEIKEIASIKEQIKALEDKINDNQSIDESKIEDEVETKEVEDDVKSDEDEKETIEDEIKDESKDEERILNNNNNSNIRKMNKEFRLIKAIRDVANNRSMDDVTKAVANAGAEEMRKAGLSYGGQIQIPTSEMRAAVTVTAEGEDVVVFVNGTDCYLN